ncbi:MAG TPA: haloacid dehalogenase type II [Candidatus Binataceae bacterium]|nr:haloacid dehalogenase type II [Candidatus Binataceae bacterium]
MAVGIGIDVYGTLIDPLRMSDHLRPLTGDAAEAIAAMWRAKQLEYTFRRAAMGSYENFDICTRDALRFVLDSMKIALAEPEQVRLLEAYQSLPPYADALAGLLELRRRGHTVAAFSNGVEATLRKLLGGAGLLDQFDAVISVDELKTFKPDPRVYRYLAERLGRELDATWLISSNAFDVIGAKNAGLRAAWIQRDPATVFDPWPLRPDLVASSLERLAALMP